MGCCGDAVGFIVNEGHTVVRNDRTCTELPRSKRRKTVRHKNLWQLIDKIKTKAYNTPRE